MTRCWYLMYLGSLPTLSGCGSACLSTPLAQIHDPAGVTFIVTRTDCDTLAKDSAVSVSAIRDGAEGSGLLLKYDPWGDEVPRIHVAEDGTILVHLSRASSILEQRQSWEAFKIRVAIDRLTYPNGR